MSEVVVSNATLVLTNGVAVAAGEFWPPAEPDVRADADWAGLFHQGTAESVALDWNQGGVR